jgi:hypothetical protein
MPMMPIRSADRRMQAETVDGGAEILGIDSGEATLRGSPPL